MVVEYSSDARSLVRLFDVNGTAAGEVNLPGLGTATGFTGSGKKPETFFSYSDYQTPTRICDSTSRRMQSAISARPRCPRTSRRT